MQTCFGNEQLYCRATPVLLRHVSHGNFVGVWDRFLCRACRIGINHWHALSSAGVDLRRLLWRPISYASCVCKNSTPFLPATMYLPAERSYPETPSPRHWYPPVDTVRATISGPQSQQWPRSHIYSCQRSQTELLYRLDVGSAGLRLCSLGVVHDAAVAGSSREIAFSAVLHQNPQSMRLPSPSVMAKSLQKYGASGSCQATCVDIQGGHMPTSSSTFGSHALPGSHCAAWSAHASCNHAFSPKMQPGALVDSGAGN